jgi:DNA-binding transcriptional ArsR family regulator
MRREIGMKREPTAGELRQAAGIFKALSHPDRLRLACLLAARNGVTQKELVAELGWPQSTVARHLGALRDRELVVGTREGVEVLLEATHLPRILLDGVCEWLDRAAAEEEADPRPATHERVLR